MAESFGYGAKTVMKQCGKTLIMNMEKEIGVSIILAE